MSAPELSEQERQKILVDWNSTQADFPSDLCLHQLFEKHAAAAPDAIALVYRDESFTYGRLDRLGNQLARYLGDRGFGPESLVGICTERSAELVIGILGILKAGAAYVPVDPDYPRDRVRFMLEDTRVTILLTQEHLVDRLPDLDAEIFCLDSGWDEVDALPESQPETGVTSDNLCYVIYTSGSTGLPKGISLRHQGVVNNIYDLNTSFDIGADARIMAISALGFDMCVYEVLGTLAAGGAIVMPEQWGLKDPAHWAELVHKHGVTVWNSAPALLEMLVDYVEARPHLQPLPIRVVIQGGDWEPVSLPDRLRAISPGATVVVLGGATEASIHSIVYVVDKVDPEWKSIPYGKPMKNQTAYILDEQRNPLPVGEPGELHLGGIGLARGYFERPELTAEKFIPHPFIEGERIYRTGDLARWSPDGNIELLGRIDFQVKIRGHRIELGEIVARLQEHEDVQQAVVILREDEPGEKRLTAYVIPEDITTPGDDQDGVGEHVNQWTEVYDEVYSGELGIGDGQLNFIGWNDSYTGLPFPGDVLEEMLNHTADRILVTEPERIMEIGCGTGLVLLKVAPHAKEYHAADISATAIDDLRKKIESDEERYAHVQLKQGAADEPIATQPRHYDTMIMNSVLQHFPDIEYLTRVIDSAIEATADGGTFFIGDVRSLPLQEIFHTSIECFMASKNLPMSKLHHRIQRRTRNEKELAVDPEYFLTLAEHNSRVSHVAVVLKRGRQATEFNKYHFDVYLRIGAAAKPKAEAEYYTWNREFSSFENLVSVLEASRAPVLRFQRIPNERLAQDLKLFRTIAGGEALNTAGDLMMACSASEKRDGIDPEDIWSLADRMPYDVEICFSESDDEGAYDAVFRHSDLSGSVSMVELLSETSRRKLSRKADYFYANQPYQEKSRTGLVPALRKMLADGMPDYMVPRDIMLLGRLPLTPNGKVDRRALPIPDQDRPEMQDSYVAPAGYIQEAIAVFWSEILELEKIGARDSFLTLGGHSLKAIQIATRINETFEVHLGINDIFEQKTIENLSQRLAVMGSEIGVDVEGIAQVVVETSKLSADEIEALLE